MRRLVPALSAAVLLCAGLAAAWGATVPRWGSLTLRDVVLRQLRDDGDPVPAAMRYVHITGADGTPLYQVVLVGHFTARTESRPANVPAPTGTTLILDIDARTAVVTDMSLSNRPAPDMGRVGHGRTVPL